MEPSRISAPRLLSRMGERTFRPVMASGSHAFAHFELVHSEVVAGVDVRHGWEGPQGRPHLIIVVIRREEPLQRGGYGL